MQNNSHYLDDEPAVEEDRIDPNSLATRFVPWPFREDKVRIHYQFQLSNNDGSVHTRAPDFPLYLVNRVEHIICSSLNGVPLVATDAQWLAGGGSRFWDDEG